MVFIRVISCDLVDRFTVLPLCSALFQQPARAPGSVLRGDLSRVTFADHPLFGVFSKARKQADSNRWQVFAYNVTHWRVRMRIRAGRVDLWEASVRNPGL